MFDAVVRMPTDPEILQLEQWRKEFAAADLEFPVGPGVATAVARRRDGSLIGSLSASIITAVSLDPLIRNPDAGRAETLAGLFALTANLEYQAQLNGAAASFIAIPNLLSDYQELVQKLGFSETAQHCRIFRRTL